MFSKKLFGNESIIQWLKFTKERDLLSMEKLDCNYSKLVSRQL